MGKIQLTGKLICENLEQIDLIKKYLPEHIELTMREPGCISFSVNQSEDPTIWLVQELFLDQVAFNSHQNRTISSTWGLKTKDIKREYKIVDLENH